MLSQESRSSEKFMHGIKVLMAKNYIDNLSEEARKGMQEKAEQGIWPTRAPLGYRNITGLDGKTSPQTGISRRSSRRCLNGTQRANTRYRRRRAKHGRAAGLVPRRGGGKVATSKVHRSFATGSMDLPRFERGESLGSCHSSVPARVMVRPSRTAAGAAPKAPPTQLHTIELSFLGRTASSGSPSANPLICWQKLPPLRLATRRGAQPIRRKVRSGWGTRIRTNLPPDFELAGTPSQELACRRYRRARVRNRVRHKWLRAPATNDPIIRPEPPFPVPGPVVSPFGVGEADAPGLSSRK